MHPHLWPGGLRGPLLPHLSQAAACWPLGPGPGPARRTSSRPSAARLPGVPGRPDLRQWRPCSYRNPVRPGGGPLARRSASCPEPCVPRQPPGAPERPPAARRRRLRLLTAGIEQRGSERALRAAVPSARQALSRFSSVEKTGNFASLRQAEQATPRLTGRRHPLSRRKWKQLPIFACRRCTIACLLWPAGTTNQLHRVFLHHTVSEADSLGFRRQEARPI